MSDNSWLDFLNTGILSPAPSNVDTESASSESGSLSDPEGKNQFI